MANRRVREAKRYSEPIKNQVLVVADSQPRLSELKASLGPSISVRGALLDEQFGSVEQFDGFVVHADLSRLDAIVAIKELMTKCQSIEKRMFLIDNLSHLASAQARALGATHVMMSRSAPSELRRHFENAEIESEMRSSPINGTVSDSAQQISSLFRASQRGQSIDLVSLQRSGEMMIDGIMEHGLSSWLNSVRRHHEGTYQHCLLVAGVLVDFGISLNARRDDIRKLYLAAILHDIGKSKIPLSILDKAGKLGAGERSMIETHPMLGYEMLKDDPGVTAEVLDAIRHHHEYLDGTGYPDRLESHEIADIVRMLTISDIFAALIEDRRYKPPMSRQQAYGILEQMSSKLEMPLVRAFRCVALDR